VELALGRDILLLKQTTHLLHPLLEAFAALVYRYAEAGKLMRQEGACEPNLEPAARDRVEHTDLARQLERMVECGEHGPCD
jgi:hypothetical protein